MNAGQEARSRHVAAFVAEALGDGAAPDLTARIAARVAGVRPRSWRPLLVAVVVVAGVGVVVATAMQRRGEDTAKAVAQDPVVAKAAEVTLRVMPQERGEVAWFVGERRAATPEELGKELRTAWRNAKDGELVITPDAGTEWRHVAATTDAAHAAGFLSIRYAAVDTPRLVPKQQEGADLAEARFSVPDEEPSPDRPTLEVFVDGRIAHGGEVLFRPAQREGDRGDTAKLRARLQELRDKLLPAGERELQPSGRKVLTTPLLLRVHRGAEWQFVQLTLRLATDPAVGFDAVEFAVAGPRRDGDPVRAERRR